MIDKKLIEIDRSGLLPAGVILTGGGAKLPGMVELAKREFRLPACLGLPVEVNTAIDKVNDASYTTAVGLALWGKEFNSQSKSSFFENIVGLKNLKKKVDIKKIDKIGKNIKSWVKKITP